MASRDLIKPIEISGLRELQRALRELDGESQKKLRLVLNEAAETVIGGARRRVPDRSGKARGSLKARSGQREAIVMGGGRKAPYYPWLDFGGKVGRDRSVQRTFVKSGRYLYPSWAASRRSVLEALAEAITDLAREAGLEVS
jgi:hypothetical protein